MATIQGIYVALFGRPADPGGLAYWNGVTNNGSDLSKLIGQLTASQEYLDRFKGKTNAEIVTTIYQSLFGRAPDAEGLKFFVGGLDGGTLKLETIAINILDGAQGSDKTLLESKIAAGNLFTSHLDLSIEIAAYNGNAAAQIGRDYIDSITKDHAGSGENADAAILKLLVSGGQAPAGGGGGNQPSTPSPVGTFENGIITIAANTHASYTANGDGTATISSPSHASLVVKVTEIAGVVINSGAKLDIPGVDLAGHTYPVSGSGTLNATGVTFVEANGSHPFEASSDFDPSLIQSNFQANGNTPDGFKALWDFIDDHYTAGDNYYNMALNKSGVMLGISYLNYLKNGGEPLTDVMAKFQTDARAQSMHDNLLGNLHELSINDKFGANTELRDELLTAVSDAGASGRPINPGYTADEVNGARGDQARAWDYEHSLKRTDYVEKNKDASVDSSASTNGKLFVGSGNSADHFNVIRHEGAGIELALKAKVRGDHDYSPSNQDSDGVVTYGHVKGGTQTASWGTAADWSFDFSVATGLNGSSKSLNDYKFELSIDVDPTAETKWLVLDLKSNGDGSMPWVLSSDGTTVVINDDDSSATKLSQNSVNIGFQAIIDEVKKIDIDPSVSGLQAYNFGNGVFDIKLEAFGSSDVVLATNHIRVDVVDSLIV